MTSLLSFEMLLKNWEKAEKKVLFSKNLSVLWLQFKTWMDNGETGAAMASGN